MLCPLDGTPLIMTDRQGVEIDYCPKCRGVWLDRGELDKIIERSAAQSPADSVRPNHRSAPQYTHPMDARDQSRGHQGGYQGSPQDGYQDRHQGRHPRDPYEDRRPAKQYKKKRKSGLSDLLEDIFDF